MYIVLEKVYAYSHEYECYDYENQITEFESLEEATAYITKNNNKKLSLYKKVEFATSVSVSVKE